MKRLKNKLLVFVFIIFTMCLGYYKCSYAATGVTIDGHSFIKDGALSVYLVHNPDSIDDFLDASVSSFLNHVMTPGAGNGHGSNIKCNNATCMFHQQGTISGAQYKIAHVIDIEDSVLKVDGTTVNPSDVAEQKSITQMAYAVYNAYKNGDHRLQ